MVFWEKMLGWVVYVGGLLLIGRENGLAIELLIIGVFILISCRK